jgi:serine/threonine protein phosphatase PrpC
MTLAKNITLTSFALSDKGLVRPKNEDSFGFDDTIKFYAVADGLGGKNAGEVASKETVKNLLAFINDEPAFKNPFINADDALQMLIEGIKNINTQIFELSKTSHTLEGMATTLTTLLFINQKAIFTNTGDSRLYRLRDDQLTKLTKDDTLLEELLQFGLIDEKEAKIFPLKHVITKSIGTFEHVEPSFGIDSFQSNDLYLLCSDGLYGFVKDEDIKNILKSSINLKDKANQLLAAALKSGGLDNITIILTEIK